ncbi:MAG: TatD family hydrolase [Candidatus Omnitrophica bacterium]|nr:TatD family hydrolase [Candidatus Omnitrophota bacterium]MDD5654042.1 TatD family hydrolase [Candidatus Omnitrophota bacterium]
MLIDTHCHLDFPEFDPDRDDVLRRAHENDVKILINIGSSLAGSRNSVALSRKYENIYAAAGIHPHEADNFKDTDVDVLKGLSADPKVVAIGEIGLDFYKNYSSADNQKRMFRALLALAKEACLPVVIHSRQADEDMLVVLKEALPLKGVIHCFSGDERFMDECLKMGFYISFTCNITYKKADNLREMVKRVPLERLLLETDAPYLSPQEFRGRRNEPLYVKNLADEISRLKGESIESISSITSSNAIQLFNLK